MKNIQVLNGIFCEVFSVKAFELNDTFNKCTVDGWDSVKQLSLTSSIEESFDIMLDPEDIIECTSYANAKNILMKYNIEL